MAWLSLRGWFAALLCLLLAVGCTNTEESPRSTPAERVGQLTQPLTSSELAMLGFETMTWTSIWNPATLSQSTLHSEGTFSLKIANIGYTAVRHAPALASDGSTFTVVGYDIRVPPLNEQPNPWWLGDTWLYIDAPSKGINLVNLGSKPLQNPGQFTRMEFAIPTWIRTALAGNYTDLKFTIAINTTPGNGAHYLDRFTLGPGTCVPTDDGNPCTEDACNAAGQPIHTPKPAGTSCTDANQCNGAEVCNASGVCQPGTPPVIDDGNPCTTDSCTPATGVAHVPVTAGTSCSDANACNGAEVCNATAVCTPGTTPLIDDGNPCTADSCDPATGVQHVALPSGTACANGDACDGAEVCNASGTCQSGTPPSVDDGNPCTSDSCDPEDGVLHVPVSAGTSCSDANACNGSEICNGAGGCAPGTPPAVDDGNPCTADSCDPVTGVAHNPVPSGTSCADADLCNGTELCNSTGVCVAGSPSTIDDGNPCTADSCDPVTGVAHVPLPAGSSCDDDTVCNGTEVCSASAVCQPGTPLDPDDDNPCTTDACDPVAGVQHQPTPGASCADTDVCNGAEVCSSAGTCVAGTPLDPDDQNPCTADSCDPVSGVANIPVAGGTSCNDGDVCNGSELCDASGSCQPSPPLETDDQNPCTADSCDPVTGVEHTAEPAGTGCSDGDVCTGAEVCDGAGTCDPGTPLDMDDGNPCTEDSCDPLVGVVHSAIADGAVCNDNNACTQTDTCQGGTCTGAQPVVCTALDQCHGAGTCEPSTGACSNPLLADGTACDDGDACTLGEACAAGSCGAGTPLDADDGNPCTADSCDSEEGVLHTPVAVGTSCDDGDLCNGIATCDASGVCEAGTPLACDDGNACNGVETCQAATGCVSGTPPPVNDGNPCTADSCDPLGGVQHEPVAAGTSCSDGDECNGSEVCDEMGACASGVPLDVDDGNPCTLDSCDAIGGVLHVPVAVGTACDLDACTVGGSCDISGYCVGGVSAIPDDGDPCTVETCDPETGPHSSVCIEDATVATTVPGSMAFLYTGANPAQQGVDSATIVVERAASIGGRVLDRDGIAVPGVRVAIVGRPEFGFTNTQSDGSYQLVVNGGGLLRVAFERPPYLSVERQTVPAWGDRTTVPDVVLVAPDDAVTTIDLQDTSEPFQVHESSVVSDGDGTRQGVLMFPAGTQATMELADGTLTPIDTLNVRVTEFTVGDTGPLAMPGELPAVSAYTYAFEVNADEAVAAGAPSITFDPPLIYYVDNFLGFPAGTNVPVGAFNRESGQWRAEKNGIVITITGVSGGVANLDVTGDGLADNDATLGAIGIDLDERTQLGQLYSTGSSLWRVDIPHFTEPYDCNWGYMIPEGAGPPPDDSVADDSPDSPEPPPGKCEVSNASSIECETQILRETMAIAGTEFGLTYSSDRVPGRRDYRTVRIPLSGASVPEPLKRIDLEVRVGGKLFKESFPPVPLQFKDFTWDGKDAFERLVQGTQRIESTVRFAYDPAYGRTSSFGSVPNVVIDGSQARNEVYLSRRSERLVGVWDARQTGLGGWTLDVHHMYEPATGILQLGDGRRVSHLPSQSVVESWPKAYAADNGPPKGDGGPADVTKHQDPGALAVAADGTIFVVDGHNANAVIGTNIRRITPSGIIDRFAGVGYDVAPGFNGDGLPALQTRFFEIRDIALAPDGSLYLVEPNGHRVRRIGPDGIVTTVAGTGTAGFAGNGGPATSARLNLPEGIALGRAGELYIADRGNRRVRKVTTDGIITTIGGNGNASSSFHYDTGSALGAGDPIEPADVAEHPDGSVYAIERRGVIRRYDLQGMVSTVAGTWCSSGCPAGQAGYGIPALGALIGSPQYIAIDSVGTVYLTDDYRDRVMRVTPSGTLQVVANGEGPGANADVGAGSQIGNGAPATDLRLRGGIGGLALGPDGVYFDHGTSITESMIYRTRAIRPALGEGLYVTDPNSDDVFVFDWEGRHLATRSRAGEPRYTFTYDPSGLLTSVVDEYENVTSIERSANGEAERIVGPYGHTTELSLDDEGYLESATDPEGRSVAMTYDSEGLLRTFTDTRGNTGSMDYDGWGRLESDTDAAGGVQALSSSGNVSDWTTTRETGEGRLHSYQLEHLLDGTYRRTNTFPDGTQAIAEYGDDGAVTTWLPNGRVVEVTATPDPRFRMQDPETITTTWLPSGLVRVDELERTASLTNPADPLSVTTEVTTTSINGKDWVTTYTASNRTTAVVSPVGRWSRTYVNAQGRLTRRELPSILPIDLTYDTRGRLQTTTQGTRVRTNAYFNTADARNGYLQTATDALNQLTTYERDAIGRVLDQTAPDSTVTSFDWDPNGNLIGLTPPGRPEHTQGFTPVNLQDQYTPPVLPTAPNPATTFAFDLDRQPTTTWRPDGLSFERVYDTAGKLDLIDTPGGTIDYSYFGVSGATPGSLASIAHPSGVNLAYNYDGPLLTGNTWSGPVNGGIEWSYNNDFRVTTETVTSASAPAPISFAYDNDGLQTCASPTTCPSGAGALRVTYDPLLPRPTSSVSGAVTDIVTYNTYGELASYSASASGDLVFSEVLDTATAPRDQLGRIVDRTETNGGVTTTYSYEYDLQGRLIEVYQDGDLAESYTYDDNGNRLSLDTPESGVTATYDDQDRLLTYGDFAYTYTANGELLTKTDSSTGDITAYEFDVFGNLVRVDLPNGDVIEYLVDGRNRRVGKRVNGSLVKQWLWSSQLRIAAELDGAGNLVSRFVYGDKPTTPELVLRGSAVYRVVSDHLGSVRALVNISDPTDVPVRLDYEAFGSVSGTGASVIPHGFAGGLYDAETGLVRFGARDFEPVVGRWVSKDPIRFDGGVNLFVYANGDPINFVDANGQFVLAPAGVAALAVAAAGVTLGAMWLGDVIGDLMDDADVPVPLTCDAPDEAEDDCPALWAAAHKKCAELTTTPGRVSRRLRGGHRNLTDCAKGHVPQRCRGNEIDYGKPRPRKVYRG